MPTVMALVAATAVALTGCTGRTAEADAQPSASGGRETADREEGPIRTALRGLVTDGEAPGAAVLVRDGGATRFATAGVADTRTGRRIQRDDHFRAGSVTKTVIAAVTLRLTGEGRLDLADTVEEHLPGLVRGHGNNGRKITLRQLLSHTSGLFDYTADPVLARQLSATEGTDGTDATGTDGGTHSPASLIRAAVAHPPSFAPGAKWQYSNTNYVLLGMIVEQVTGRSYAAEAERRVLAPLALRNTSFPGSRTTLPAPHGHAYDARGGDWRDVTDLDPSAAGAAGEMISTLDDLSRFLDALLRGEVVPKAQLRRMEDTSASGGRYGMGLFPMPLRCGTTVWGHNGEINGSYALAVSTRDGRHTLVYRLNSAGQPDPDAETALLTAEFCPQR
ncbi:serine hydrolase domain-containing protein [Streptomyces sp. RTd22]|uniref:serine hydrolase domain-containing protein n=1 Tax=Streptomyces sp. RTd22 TaxID=1841249 RepID=UPI000AEDDBE4|nr:serine hydrolase domain-containing protein [Streptomyces sp. RTd22]